jgi:GT2 family glycosyltransferase
VWASVVVVPRERFTSLPVSLRSLFATISPEVPVVVVEGASPRETRAELEALRTERPYELISLPYMVKPNEARNRGIAAVSSEYVVIADNDIEFEHGWLDALESHALANDSDAVAPLICIGPPAATVIHHAGGLLKAARTERGGIKLSEAHRLMNVPLADASGSFPAIDNHVCEFHCMLVRRALLDEMGGLDERLITREQLDFAMRALVLDARVTFAADAVVTYMARDAFDPIDLRYHLFRWSDPFVVESLDAFESTWGVELDRDLFRNRWTSNHRLRAAETTYPRRRKLLGKDLFRRLVVERLASQIVGEQQRARSGLVASVPTAPNPARVQLVMEHLLEATRGLAPAR